MVPRACVLISLAVGAIACGGEGPPVAYVQGEPIPLHSHSLRVERYEAAQFGPSLSLSLLLTLEPLETSHRDIDARWVELFAKLRLMDVNGRRHRPVGLSPLGLEQMASGPTSAEDFERSMSELRDQTEKLRGGVIPEGWNRWRITFHVPSDAEPYTLLIENPKPRKGEPRLASVEIRG